MRWRGTLAAAAAWLLLSACGGGDELPAVPEAGATEPAPSDAAGTTEPAPSDATGATAETGNRPPVVDRLELDPQKVSPGGEVAARIDAHDPDGDGFRIEYRWRVDGEDVDEHGPFLTVEEAGRDGRIELTVVARDDAGAESTPRKATASVGNAAPRVLGVTFDPEGGVSSDQDLTAEPLGVDDDDDTLEWRLRWSVNGRDLAETGRTLGADQLRRGDTVVLTVVASDGSEDSEPFESEPIKVGNAAPVITSTPGSLDDDGVFRYAVAAEDADGDEAFSYRLLEGPNGMTIGGNDGSIEWKPGPDLIGRHAVEVEVADVYGGRGSQTFELELSYKEEDAPAAPDDSDL